MKNYFHVSISYQTGTQRCGDSFQVILDVDSKTGKKNYELQAPDN
jgi:hypothetical protein